MIHPIQLVFTLIFVIVPNAMITDSDSCIKVYVPRKKLVDCSKTFRRCKQATCFQLFLSRITNENNFFRRLRNVLR